SWAHPSPITTEEQSGITNDDGSRSYKCSVTGIPLVSPQDCYSLSPEEHLLNGLRSQMGLLLIDDFLKAKNPGYHHDQLPLQAWIIRRLHKISSWSIFRHHQSAPTLTQSSLSSNARLIGPNPSSSTLPTVSFPTVGSSTVNSFGKQ